MDFFMTPAMIGKKGDRMLNGYALMAVERAPKEPGGYQMLGMLALSMGEYDRAIAFREKALTLAPNDFLVLFGLGSALYKAGEPKRAIYILKKSERQNPSHTAGLSWATAEAQLVAGQYEDAIETSGKALEIPGCVPVNDNPAHQIESSSM
jgi:tetratricopeptide (TPR) repeat protein